MGGSLTATVAVSDWLLTSFSCYPAIQLLVLAAECYARLRLDAFLLCFPLIFQFYSYLSQQQNMMQDYIRTGTYQRAILSNGADFLGKVCPSPH